MPLPASLRAGLFGACLLFTGLAAAQTSCPPEPPGPGILQSEELRRDVRDRGFLWRLEKDGRSSWLYGTVHVSRPQWALPGRRVQAALLDSDVVALELDPADPDLPRVFSGPGDPARAQRVTAGLRPRIERLAARECLRHDSIAGMRPILQLTMLSLFEGRRDGFHPELAVDAVLWGLARHQGKRIVALETPASQLAALSPGSEADERVLLTQGLEELESGAGRTYLKRLLQAWADGDEVALASYPEWCRCMETAAERRYLQRINDERNVAMAAKLGALHASGSRFFAAVGALHMTGPKALHQLLRAQGFQVRRVPFS
jgi:uncharacterized protein YbaP (TraB family)